VVNVNITVKIDDKEIEDAVKDKVLFYLKGGITMKFVRDIVAEEIRNTFNRKLKEVFKDD